MMKKTILLLVAALCGVLTAAAQDLIVKTDATKVEAKVTEITPDAVRYKRFSNPDGPTYVLPVADIDYIQYANGEKEYYTKTIPATPLRRRLFSRLRRCSMWPRSIRSASSTIRTASRAWSAC